LGLYGGQAFNVGAIVGSAYNDSIFAEGETVHAGNGNDFVGADQAGADLYGDVGNDFLSGGQNGYDFLYGGEGNDTLRATLGGDLTGGKGNDTFQINYQYEDALTGFSSDGSIINDFKQ